MARSRVPYRDMPELLETRTEFYGNSVHASAWSQGYPDFGQDTPLNPRYRDTSYPSVGATYVVYSYSTPIAWIDRDGYVVVPDVYWSRTTTRIQNLCREHLQPDASVQELVTILAHIDELAEKAALRSIAEAVNS